MNFQAFFTKTFLLDIGFPAVRNFDKVVMVVSLGAILIALVLWLAAKFSATPIDAKYRSKISNPFWYMGIAGVLWYGLRYQQVRLLSARIIIMLIAISALAWLVSVLIKTFKHYSTEKTDWEKQQLKAKYLPK